jgi:hypothetical protein
MVTLGVDPNNRSGHRPTGSPVAGVMTDLSF